MCDDFLLGSIVLGSCITIWICDGSWMMSCFIVVANCIENEVPDFSSESLVLILEVLSWTNVRKILGESIEVLAAPAAPAAEGAEGYEQIK